MALKAVLDTLDGIDDAVKPLYAETDGRFVLAVEGVDELPDVRGLVTANRTNAEKAQQRQAKIEALTAQMEELKKTAPDTAATQARMAQMQEQLEAATAQAQEWQGKYVGKARDEALTQALNAAGIVNPAFVKASQALLAGQVKLGDDGTPYVETAMGPKVLGDYVKTWAGSEGKDFVAPASGGGAGGSKGGGNMKQSPLAGIPGFADLPER